jgi:hypothetical protein
MYDFKHLTLEQRMDIQLGLKEGLALKDLSERIRKSPEPSRRRSGCTSSERRAASPSSTGHPSSPAPST